MKAFIFWYYQGSTLQMIKRLWQKVSLFNAGVKQRKKGEYELRKLDKPVYKTN